MVWKPFPARQKNYFNKMELFKAPMTRGVHAFNPLSYLPEFGRFNDPGRVAAMLEVLGTFSSTGKFLRHIANTREHIRQESPQPGASGGDPGTVRAGRG